MNELTKPEDKPIDGTEPSVIAIRDKLDDALSCLILKRQRFVLAYAQSGNAAQSAREAGYSVKTARSMGNQLLTFIDVKAALSLVHELDVLQHGHSIQWKRQQLDNILVSAQADGNHSAATQVMKVILEMDGDIKSGNRSGSGGVNITILTGIPDRVEKVINE